jgi:hypothetical protein
MIRITSQPAMTFKWPQETKSFRAGLAPASAMPAVRFLNISCYLIYSSAGALNLTAPLTTRPTII